MGLGVESLCEAKRRHSLVHNLLVIAMFTPISQFAGEWITEKPEEKPMKSAPKNGRRSQQKLIEEQPVKKKLKTKAYEQELSRLQVELVKLQ